MFFTNNVLVIFFVTSCLLRPSLCASAGQGQTFADVNFSFRRNIPYYEKNDTLYSDSSRSAIVSYGRCAVECIEDLSCHAIELCDVTGVTECRATVGLMMTSSTTDQKEICKQYFLDFSCGDEAYLDRRKGLCVFAFCSDCDCVRKYNTKSGGYGLNIDGSVVFVLCHFETNHTWTVIQNRYNGTEDFDRNWIDYTNGFGSVHTEYWIGTEYIYRLTNAGLTSVRIELEDFDSDQRFAEYSVFRVANGSDYYRLSISGYSGDAGDSMSVDIGDFKADGEMFSTYDVDNDSAGSKNCAAQGRSGWWYGAKCSESSLNGEYGNNSKDKGINWGTFRGMSYSLKSSVIKLRRP